MAPSDPISPIIGYHGFLKNVETVWDFIATADIDTMAFLGITTKDQDSLKRTEPVIVRNPELNFLGISRNRDKDKGKTPDKTQFVNIECSEIVEDLPAEIQQKAIAYSTYFYLKNQHSRSVHETDIVHASGKYASLPLDGLIPGMLAAGATFTVSNNPAASITAGLITWTATEVLNNKILAASRHDARLFSDKVVPIPIGEAVDLIQETNDPAYQPPEPPSTILEKIDANLVSIFGHRLSETKERENSLLATQEYIASGKPTLLKKNK
ncbi:MAG: hypothetical protein JWM96_712 [Alphaproteobacteria bacterium]|nr:hypothetical protein [Alphaproteobacteria bacterium]